MSHWTKAKVNLKDISILTRVAKELGVTLTMGKTTIEERYAGTLEADGVITDSRGGKAALVKKGVGYELIMDNWGNSLTGSIGTDGQKLCREYTTAIVKNQAMVMGGSITNFKEHQDGSREIHISI